MSAPRKRNDVERTRCMLDLVRRKYDAESGMSRAWVACEEVADGTGWGAGRFADVLAFAVWPSLKHVMIGYEVKASRSDLKRELADLSKHEALACFCDEWWLVAWDESVLLDGIPASWGILLTREADGDRELFVHRKAEKREAEPWTRNFVASLVRNAYDQSPRAGLLVNIANEAVRQERPWAKQAEERRQRELIAPLCRLLFGDNDWRWPREAHDPAKVIEMAVQRLRQGELPLGGVA